MKRPATTVAPNRQVNTAAAVVREETGHGCVTLNLVGMKGHVLSREELCNAAVTTPMEGMSVLNHK
jgi:hypothetical protein